MKSVLTVLVSSLLAAVIAATVVTVVADDPAQTAEASAGQRVAAGAAFTYQGRLDTGGSPANGTYDFKFTLYDADTAGAVVAGPLSVDNVNVTNGLFTATLDLGSGPFSGSARWLSIEAKADAAGTYDLLAPRQALTPVPYALFALSGGTQYTAGSGLTLSGTQFSVEFLAAGPVTGTASTAARSNHIHFGETWMGNAAGPGLSVTNLGAGNAVLGTSASGSASGVFGDNTGGGYGVTGRTTGAGIGVYGQSPAGYGVLGGSVGNDAVVGVSTSARGVLALSQGVGPNGSALFAQNTGGGIGIWNETNTSDAATVVRNAGTGYLLKMFDADYNVRFSVTSNGYTEARALSLKGLSNIGPATLSVDQPDVFRSLIRASVGGSAKFLVSAAGNVFADGTYTSPAFDLAEHVTTSGTEPGPGDVVEVDPDTTDGFRLAQSPNSALVAGVISTAPGVVLGSGNLDNPSTSPQLALAGRVPVKVSAENGAIRPGDLLVSCSTAGHAMKAPANPAAGTVIGKALGSLDSGTGTITMLVMLR